tara:strand:+ start:2502 stop:2738 length:237 start_codon:yes stop_codon:yes gene_type:complete
MEEFKDLISSMKMRSYDPHTIPMDVEITYVLNTFKAGMITDEQGKELLEYLVVKAYLCGKTDVLEGIAPKLKQLEEML